MKTKRIVCTVLSLIISAFVFTFSILSVMAYSSDEDPLITLSYLNEVVIPQLKAELSGITADINSNEETANDEKPAEISENDEQAEVKEDDVESVDPYNSDIGTYQTIELNAGETLLAKSALEIIVRPGSIVTAVSPFETQGVADITNGNELFDGDEFAINAYCIIPRGDDGRGLYVVTEKAYILIRGEYEIG